MFIETESEMVIAGGYVLDIEETTCGILRNSIVDLLVKFKKCNFMTVEAKSFEISDDVLCMLGMPVHLMMLNNTLDMIEDE